MRTLLLIIVFIFSLSFTSCVVHTRATPAKVVVVKRPVKYKVVRVKGTRYYVWNGHYHKKTKRGYVIVRI
jgi:hypothetical protein